MLAFRLCPLLLLAVLCSRRVSARFSFQGLGTCTGDVGLQPEDYPKCLIPYMPTGRQGTCNQGGDVNYETYNDALTDDPNRSGYLYTPQRTHFATLPDGHPMHLWAKDKVKSVCQAFERAQDPDLDYGDRSMADPKMPWHKGLPAQRCHRSAGCSTMDGDAPLVYCMNVSKTANHSLPMSDNNFNGRYSVRFEMWRMGNDALKGEECIGHAPNELSPDVPKYIIDAFQCNNVFDGYLPWEFKSNHLKQGPWACPSGGEYCAPTADGQVCARIDFLEPSNHGDSWRNCEGSWTDTNVKKAAWSVCRDRYYMSQNFMDDFETTAYCQDFQAAKEYKCGWNRNGGSRRAVDFVA